MSKRHDETKCDESCSCCATCYQKYGGREICGSLCEHYIDNGYDEDEDDGEVNPPAERLAENDKVTGDEVLDRLEYPPHVYGTLLVDDSASAPGMRHDNGGFLVQKKGVHELFLQKHWTHGGDIFEFTAMGPRFALVFTQADALEMARRYGGDIVRDVYYDRAPHTAML